MRYAADYPQDLSLLVIEDMVARLSIATLKVQGMNDDVDRRED